MADISVTASAVQKTSTTTVRKGVAGGTVTAGQPIYKDSTDNNDLKPAQADTAAKSKAIGVALHGASDGQPLEYATRGDVTFNAVLTVGQVYVVSDAAAGGIAPVADLASGDYPTLLGVATTTTNLKLGILAAEVAKP